MNHWSRLVDRLHRRGGLVHRADWAFALLALSTGACGFFPPTVWSTALHVLLSGLTIFMLVAALVHGARLCERCVTEFVIDAPERAARHERRFWFFHQSAWGLALMMIPLGVSSFLDAPWRGVGFTFVAGAQVASALLSRFHGSYQPWCPFCRRGRGGDDETEAVPDPTGGHGRPLPVM